MKTTDKTKRSFSDKWHKNRDLAFSETLREDSDFHRWILERNGFETPAALREHLAGRKRILDAGCGNGRVTALLREYSDPETTEVAGVDLTAADVAEENLRSAGYENCAVHSGDLLGDLEFLGEFDFIYCQEVLHHTGDARAGFLNLVGRLQKGGEIAIYVYKEKAPVREFVDDFIREEIENMPYEEAMAVCEQVTELGRRLSELKVEFEAPQVDVLGIEEGRHDIQRFFYHFFMKCYWNPQLSFKDNAVINYDWYHPQDCTRHTLEEVLGWFDEAGLDVVHRNVDPYGITVRGTKA
ncbi:MAG: class I SAM-dependent methyltransferase [Verrucomicrobiales bacterium]